MRGVKKRTPLQIRNFTSKFNLTIENLKTEKENFT